MDSCPMRTCMMFFFMFSVRVGDQLFYHFIEGGKTFGFLHNSQSMPTPTAYYRQHTQEELKNAKELKDCKLKLI